MTAEPQAPALQLRPVAAMDEDWLCTLLWQPEVRRYLCDDQRMPREAVRAWIADSLDPASATELSVISLGSGNDIGLAGLRAPSIDSLKMRAIGWRSLEVIIALDPQYWGRGLAQQAVAVLMGRARENPVTFALIGCVDAPNARSHRLMTRCGFEELGVVRKPGGPLVIYEYPL